MYKIQIINSHKTNIAELELPVKATVDDLQKKFHQHIPKFYPARQRFSVGQGKDRKVLQKDKPLSEYFSGTDTTHVIEFKDLGTQVSWKTVYLSEYIGPFLLYLFFSTQPSFIYGPSTGLSYEQRLACYCFLAHFGRRLFESAFVHKWSGESLGLYFLYKNCAYYWIAGLFIGYVTNRPDWTPIVSGNSTLFSAAVGLYIISQIANMWIHLQLRFARSTDENARWLPEGFLWSITSVSFPNYFFEVIIWIAWNVAFFSIPGVIFLIAGTGQMAIWAKKKHSNYRKTFDGKEGRRLYPKHRRAMIPFLL
jgi:very-long-chain enoyl-CoA reductase